MKHLPRFLCLAVLLLLPCVARADLASDVEQLLADKSIKKGAVGVEIIRLNPTDPSKDVTLFQRDAALPLIPASNLKLISTAAALHKLGPEFKFRTVLVATEPDLAIIGAGDPSFGDGEFLRDVGWTVTTVFEGWADQLVKRGIKTVRDVVVDDSIFDEVFLHPNWPADQIQKKYVAEVGGLNLNANVLEFAVRPGSYGELAGYSTTPDTQYATISNTCITGNQNAIWLSRENGSNRIVLKGETPSRSQVPVAVTIHDPPMYAATVFAEVLRKKGISVMGTVRRDRTISAQRKAAGAAADKWRALAIHETPLTTVLARANKDSVNLYAESLCKRLGFETTGQPGSWENGSAANAAFMRLAGVGETEFKLDDGCGLSKQNAVSANAFSKLLAYNFHSPNRDVFRNSLSVAGVDGTLQDRFRGSDLRGRVFAKSGYVNGVCTLSGYVHTRDDQWFAFSFLMNRVSAIADVKLVQERIVKAIDAHASALAAGQ